MIGGRQRLCVAKRETSARARHWQSVERAVDAVMIMHDMMAIVARFADAVQRDESRRSYRPSLTLHSLAGTGCDYRRQIAQSVVT